MKTTLQAVINSLNIIEVRGQTNLALLYNSIDKLQEIMRILDAQSSNGGAKDESNDNVK